MQHAEVCPTVTVNGKPYCLNRTCRVREICRKDGNLDNPNVRFSCLSAMPEHELPDLLVGMTEAEFTKHYKAGLWDSEVEGSD